MEWLDYWVAKVKVTKQNLIRKVLRMCGFKWIPLIYIFLEKKKKVKMLTGRQMDISWSYLCNLTKNETLHIDKTITYQIYMYTY